MIVRYGSNSGRRDLKLGSTYFSSISCEGCTWVSISMILMPFLNLRLHIHMYSQVLTMIATITSTCVCHDFRAAGIVRQRFCCLTHSA